MQDRMLKLLEKCLLTAQSGDVSTHGWRTSLVVQGLDQRRGWGVPVVTGLLETAGGVQLALRVGENGQTVILPLQAASQLAVNLRGAMVERLRIAGEVVGGEES